MFILGCYCFSLEIVERKYAYEKRLFGTHDYAFEFYLSTIIDDEKKANLIKKFLYGNMEMDDYIAIKEKDFIGDASANQFPQIIDEDDTKHFYHSSYIERIVIDYINDNFIIIKYFCYFYSSGAPHGNFHTRYYIIDVSDEKLLDVDDIINELADELLKQYIQSEYDHTFDFNYRKNIWPPDTITFEQNNIILYWNVYSISSYLMGPVEIKIQYEIALSYFTEKGKFILETLY
jgi:hypothetical protein